MLQRDYRLRDAEVVGDGRTLTIACVPFDRPAYVDDGDGPYREMFRRGAFKHVVPAANRVELRYAHQRDGLPYGFGLLLREDADYLIGDFRVAPGAAGDQALALVMDRQLPGVSVGFVPGASQQMSDADGPVTVRLRVKRLNEVSLTPAPSYSGAEVLAVRDAPDLSAAVERERLWLLRARAARLR